MSLSTEFVQKKVLIIGGPTPERAAFRQEFLGSRQPPVVYQSIEIEHRFPSSFVRHNAAEKRTVQVDTYVKPNLKPEYVQDLDALFIMHKYNDRWALFDLYHSFENSPELSKIACRVYIVVVGLPTHMSSNELSQVDQIMKAAVRPIFPTAECISFLSEKASLFERYLCLAQLKESLFQEQAQEELYDAENDSKKSIAVLLPRLQLNPVRRLNVLLLTA
jgi:hypothetical protein